MLSDKYCFTLNSSDLSDPELPLVSSKAHGGTMALWKKELDPYVTVHQSPTPSILPLVFDHPSHQLSVHLTIYLPTAGRDADFTDALAHLANILSELRDLHPEAHFYIRGDANVNPSNMTRSPQFDHFCKSLDLFQLDLLHPTYHHFTGDGTSDSQLDVIRQSLEYSERLEHIFCKKENPLILSHHDLILTTFTLPSSPLKPTDNAASSKNVKAPRITNDRVKTNWNMEGIAAYKELVSPHLQVLRSQWTDPSSKSTFSVLLSSTNSILARASSMTNKTTSMLRAKAKSSAKKPHAVSRSHNLLLAASRNLKSTLANKLSSPNSISAARELVTRRRNFHKKLIRSLRHGANTKRDTHLSSVKSNPLPVHNTLRSLKSCNQKQIKKLSVADKTYSNDDVPDGFFDSLSSLKTHNTIDLRQSDNLKSFFSDYDNVVDICASGPTIPTISLKESTDIILRIRPNVNDLYSITAFHYIHAGEEGLAHFNSLLNILISDINFMMVPEMNSVYACILYKGHNKERTSDRSYRTISTCPLLAKAFDTYLRILIIDQWKSIQADTQYQGEGSSHELAALLLTEVIQFSLFTSLLPLYALYLDARSAFDRVVREFLVRNLFQSGTAGQFLLYINERLKNRLTYCDWDSNLMGPIFDTLGVEQGGVNSDNYYKLTNNEQLSIAQKSELGVVMNNITISAIGQADDVVLVSNCPQSLRYLLKLTIDYCSQYCVDLVPEKTKLQLFLPKTHIPFETHLKSSSPVAMNNKNIEFVIHTEHVGIVRSTDGNLPNILERISAHKKSIGAVLSAGLGRGHRSNPTAGLHVNKLYGTPVLMSGLPSMVLKKPEVDLVNQHYKKTLQNLQRLHEKTPECVVYFLGGHLPGKAILHLRQLSLLSMISRLPDDVLHQHAIHILTSAKPGSQSWFIHVQEICLMYSLPHPLTLLEASPTKASFKKLAKSRVLDFWETKLRADAKVLSSLLYFKPSFMSLNSPHPLWLTAGTNPYEVNKATIQARMLSGRYRCEVLCRHWSSNKAGLCLIPGCEYPRTCEDLPHILLTCKSLITIRTKMRLFFTNFISTRHAISNIVSGFLNSEDPHFQTHFLLDCSTLPEVISCHQIYGDKVFQELFYITRTWCYALHRERLRLLGRW